MVVIDGINYPDGTYKDEYGNVILPDGTKCVDVKVALSETEQATLEENITKNTTNNVIKKVGNGQPKKFLTTEQIALLVEDEGLVVDTNGQKHIWYFNNGGYVDSLVVYSQTAIQDGSVTPNKTSFFDVKNANLTKGYDQYIAGYLEYSDGSFVAQPSGGNHTTDFIELKPNYKYQVFASSLGGDGTPQPNPRVVWLYDTDKKGTRKLDTYDQRTGGFTLAPNEKYIRINLAQKGFKCDIYYFNKFNDTYNFQTKYINKIEQNQIKGFRAVGNLIKNSPVELGVYKQFNNGQIETKPNITYNCYSVIDAEYIKTLTCYKIRYLAFEGEDELAIGGVDGINEQTTIEVPNGTKKIYASVALYNIEHDLSYVNANGNTSATIGGMENILEMKPRVNEKIAFNEPIIWLSNSKLNLFRDALVQYNPKNYAFYLLRNTSNIVAKGTKKALELDLRAAYENKLDTFAYNEYGDTILHKELSVNAVNPKPINANIIVIGDSFVDGADYLNPLKEIVKTNGGELKSYGTRNNGETEGYAGWKAEDFCTKDQVNGVNNAFWYGIFNFSEYMNGHPDFPEIDYVNINVGVNDLLGSSPLNKDTIVDTTLDYVKTMVASILKYKPTMKVILNTITTPNFNLDISGERQILKANIVEYNAKLINEYTGNANVIVDSGSLVIDPETMVSDNVHLTPEGWRLLANAVYAAMCK